MNKDPELLHQAAVFKALGHKSRLMMVKALTDGEKCVCELQALVGSDLSTVSKHLSVLKNAGVVRTDKRGNNVYYELVYRCLKEMLSCVGRCSENANGGNEDSEGGNGGCCGCR